MGKNLYKTIRPYIEQRIDECDKVTSKKYVHDNVDYYIISIQRIQPYTNFKLCLCDEYRYTLNDYYSKPKEISSGDFMLLARPEALFSNEIEMIETALLDDIHIGNLRRFIKFLNNTIDDVKIETNKYLEELKENKKKNFKINL